MYQETEKFKKYGKLFMPLVGAVLLLPFLAAGIVSVCLGNFKLDGKKVSMYTAAIDDHVIYLNSDEGKKAVEEADKYVAYLQEAKRAAEMSMQWFGNRFKIFGRLRDKRAEEPERAAAQAQTAAETKTKQESDIQERGMKMVIIAGLGNPTKEYENTRHNIGFMAIDALADKYHISVMDCKHKALIGKGVIGGTKVVLVKPLTYMNLSGEAIRAVVDYYKADAESDLIVIYDDISLDVGQLRIRKKGSAGGHNGIKNIIANLKSDTFLRIKIGVGEKPKGYDLVDYVLGHFSKEELEVMKESLENVDGAVSLMLEDKVDAAMNQYNKKSKGE